MDAHSKNIPLFLTDSLHAETETRLLTPHYLTINQFIGMFFFGAFPGQRITGEPLGYDLQRKRLVVPVGQSDVDAGDPRGPRVQRHHGTPLRGDHQRHPLQKPGRQQATQ